MTLLQRLTQTVLTAGWWSAGAPVIVAVSTGVDSMMLLATLQQLPDTVRPRLIVAHVNHQLRAQSTEEQAFLAAYCHCHHLTLETGVWPLADHPKTGIEAAARDFRYRFFDQVMRRHQAKVLVTAHHADDQVETILMKLIRGGDLSQLCGINRQRPFGDGQLVRPFLSEPKQTLLAAAKKAGLKWYEDATNHEPTTVRNELRTELIPALEKINPQVKAHILDYQKQLAETMAVAQEAVAADWPQIFNDQGQGQVANWSMLSVTKQRAVLRELLMRHQLVVKNDQLTEMGQLLRNRDRPQGQLSLTAGWQFVKRYNSFYLSKGLKLGKKTDFDQQNMVVSKQWTRLMNSAVRVVLKVDSGWKKSARDTMTVSLAPSDFPLVVRAGVADDQITLKTGGHKTLRRLWIDRHLPVETRSTIPVVTTANGEVLWVLGVQRSARPIEPSQSIFQIQFKQKGKGEADE
ncbi:tRNA lysidine(34) synthetase TilS [uncultured Secundilactobacillus sp.]|uniref:tRNA lysidine(34) synthetase TilS n=1 Tax=uncultured Secundilactobacillus sp. TaxID=2813935 RepID=UPI0025860598|nr:tRNA lysidine(34) synthetase TilS [uncultured Secundilactobacillus sp.]